MKHSKIVLVLLALSLLWGAVSPALAQSGPAGIQSSPPGFASGQSAPALQVDGPEAIPVLACSGTGTGGDLANLRGIVFTVSQSFSTVEVRMDGNAAGNYGFTAELRRSSGFTGAADFSKSISSVSLPGTATTVEPYKPVSINFGNVTVSGTETFTLRFVGVSGPGSLYLETFGIGNKPCANVMETEENNVASPTERGDPAGFKVLKASPSSLSINSNYVSTPPNIDGSVGFGEWQISNQIPFDNGFITVLNDSIRLYILVDVLYDSGDDTGRTPDYFWLSFDKNKDNAITPNVDLNYGTEPATGNMRYQFYLGPSSWTGLQPNTYSSKGRGFGCFWGDGSFSFISFFPLNFKCSQHRVWEFGIDLAEIGAAAGGSARMGLRVYSPTPSFTNDIPANFFNNFSNLIQVNLGAPPVAIPAQAGGSSANLDSKPIELTQAIQNRDNTLPLVADKTTVGRVYVKTTGSFFAQPVRAYLYASKGGVDLPGSPLAALLMAPPVIDRTKLNHTANFQLPTTWDDGSVTFWSRAADFLGHQSASSPFAKAFTNKEVPTYWVVPINTGTNASPVLASNTEIASQESYLKTVYPVKNVTFVQKPWQDIGPTTVDNAISALNTYHSTVVLAWLLSVIFTGHEPFTLPDQIYGFTPSGGGLSDPVWAGGNGYVARGFRGTSLEGTMAHEINHNLDRSSPGTWGRHTPFGCGAGGPDGSWPYSNDDIQEVGFDTRLPWVDGSGGRDTVIPGTTPDFMSYCQSGRLPTKWISPYRWTNLFNNFDTVPASAMMLARTQEIQPAFYITGQVNKDGTGALDPVLAQPGIPSANVPQGDYSIEVQDATGKPLVNMPFLVSFIGVEDEELNTVYFNFQVPAPQGSAKILLKHNDQTLDEITASAHAPSVTVVKPNGGEDWSGTQTIQWSASDPDGDPLSFTILYSPDNGGSWYPVASNVSGNSLDVDASALPGGDSALIRVIASDGFYNAEDQSDAPFKVGDKGPQVVISSPGPVAQVKPGATLLLQGDATDLEDPSLPDDAFVWSSENTVLGTGRELPVSLSNGPHDIKLTVTDSNGNLGEANAQVFVGSRVFMPLLMK